MDSTTAVRALFTTAVTAIAVLAVGGCGGGSSSTSASLNPYVIHGSEETGYAIQRPLKHFKTAAAYAANQQDSGATQQLTRAGFRQALVENTGHGNGISYVMQFATTSDAMSELSSELPTFLASQDGQGGQQLRFSVPGVPGSHGFGVRVAGGQGDANVLFREGRCVLLVGDTAAPHPKSYEAAVIAGVHAIYARTGKDQGACSG